MPRIERVVPVPAPADEPWERREYPSPGGAWTLVLCDPYEVGMGTFAWAGEIWSGGRDVSAGHRPALGPSGQKRFRAPREQRPWAPDGRTVALMTGQPTIQLYRPEERSVLELKPEVAAPVTVQWSPTMDRLLVATKSGGHLYDANGMHRATARWTIGPGESPHTGWTRWGALFLVTREPGIADPPRSRTRIAFYDGAAGRLTDSLDLDPLELVPYDAARYAAVPRGRASVVIGPGARGVGSLLDTWDRIRYEEDTDTLLLATYRPTADPYVEQGHLVCRVERRWVAVTLAP